MGSLLKNYTLLPFCSWLIEEVKLKVKWKQTASGQTSLTHIFLQTYHVWQWMYKGGNLEWTFFALNKNIRLHHFRVSSQLKNRAGLNILKPLKRPERLPSSGLFTVTGKDRELKCYSRLPPLSSSAHNWISLTTISPSAEGGIYPTTASHVWILHSRRLACASPHP